MILLLYCRDDWNRTGAFCALYSILVGVRYLHGFEGTKAIYTNMAGLMLGNIVEPLVGNYMSKEGPREVKQFTVFLLCRSWSLNLCTVLLQSSYCARYM